MTTHQTAAKLLRAYLWLAILANIALLMLATIVNAVAIARDQQDGGARLATLLIVALLVADAALPRTKIERMLTSLGWNVFGIVHRGAWVGLLLFAARNLSANAGSMAAGEGAVFLLGAVMLALGVVANVPQLFVHVVFAVSENARAFWNLAYLHSQGDANAQPS